MGFQSETLKVSLQSGTPVLYDVGQSCQPWESLVEESQAIYRALAPVRSLNWTMMDFRILFKAWPRCVSLQGTQKAQHLCMGHLFQITCQPRKASIESPVMSLTHWRMVVHHAA